MDVKYEELVRVKIGYGPTREQPMAGASRNRARSIIWKTYKVEMNFSRDHGYFRVKHLPSPAHCLDYARDADDQEENYVEPNEYFEEQCGCGVVHDGSEHDTVESEGAGSVFNVRPHLQREARMPRTLPPERYVNDTWRDPEEDDINLAVLRQTGGIGPLLFLMDDDGNDNLVETVVLRYSADGFEGQSPSIKLEYASDRWLRYVNGEEVSTDSEQAEEEQTEETEEESFEPSDTALEAAEDEDMQMVDNFFAPTPPEYVMEEDDDSDSDDDADSDDPGSCWYRAHSDRIVHLLSEWLDRMRREHRLLGRIRIISAPTTDAPHGYRWPFLGESEWYRPLPGLVRPVASVHHNSSERPHYGPTSRTLRAREEGRHNLLGGLGGTGARPRHHTHRPAKTTQSLAKTGNVYLVRL